MKRAIVLFLFFTAASLCAWSQPVQAARSAEHPQAATPAQRPAPQFPLRIVSPEVHPDRSVTFRFRDPGAKQVILNYENHTLPMEKDDQGVWSVTTKPLLPDYYGYMFVADGVGLLDPSNPLMKPNLLFTQSMVYVPGTPPMPWDMTDVPHGVIHHHFYHSAVVGDNRDFYVYTPPGYDPAGKTLYPVLYLLHGYSDAANAWTAVGRANLILDNLIAQGQAKPMIVVMPLGYGAPEILTAGFGAFQDKSLVQRNMNNFRDALLTEVIPQVEKDYRVLTGRDDRAIAGLSMGGAESLYTGLNNLDKFAWVGSFSAGGLSGDYNADFPSLDSKANSQLHLLWIACGVDDRLITANRKFRDWLTSKGVHYVGIETPGIHEWLVWRSNLATFAPILFQQPAQ